MALSLLWRGVRPHKNFTTFDLILFPYKLGRLDATIVLSKAPALGFHFGAYKISDRHEPVSPVVTHLPIFLDRSTLSPVLLVTASHGRSQRAVPGFISHPRGFFRRLRGGMQEYAAGSCPLRAPVL